LTTNHYKPRRAVKMSAAADNFSWLGGAPSVFRLAAAPNDSGWRRRRESAAEGSSQEEIDQDVADEVSRGVDSREA